MHVLNTVRYESANARGHCHTDILAAELDSLVFYVYNFPLIVVVMMFGMCEKGKAGGNER